MDMLNPPNICLMSWWTDQRLSCLCHQTLKRTLATCNTSLLHTQNIIVQPSITWIMHHQTVCTELMSQLLREPQRHPYTDGYTKPSQCQDYPRHQMAKIQRDELWFCPPTPLLQCHNIKRQVHMVSPMWLLCTCECVCSKEVRSAPWLMFCTTVVLI